MSISYSYGKPVLIGYDKDVPQSPSEFKWNPSHLKGDLLYLENSQGPRIRFYSSIGLKPEVQFYLANNAFACLCCVEAELEILWAPKHLGEFNFFPITSNVTLRWIYLF